MIRTVITPEQQNILTRLPEHFMGKQVEVAAFTLKDIKEESFSQDRSKIHFASEPLPVKEWLTGRRESIAEFIKAIQ